MTDGKKKFNGKTKVQRITLEKRLSVVEEEQKGMLRDSINNELINALFIFNTSLNSDPGKSRTNEEALNGPEKDWWIPACISEMNNFLNRKSWKIVPREAVSKLNRKLIKTIVVFKNKNCFISFVGCLVGENCNGIVQSKA